MVKPFRPRALTPPSARRNRGEAAASRLRRDILLGRYVPGERLPPERELAGRLGTNRNTLREALRILEAEHLLRSRQGDGTIVVDWRAEGDLTLLPHFFAEETPADERFQAVLALLNLRERVIEEILALAVLHATPEDLHALEDAMVRLRDARPGEEATLADVEVYRRLALASHSLAMVWTFNTLARIFLELGRRFPIWRIDRRYFEGLAQVLHHLAQKRADRARESLRRLFEERHTALVAGLRPEPAPEGLHRAKVRTRPPRPARRKR